MSRSEKETQKLSTGVSGLDRILEGGFPGKRIFLVHGGPGTGKTTLGMEFLLAGVKEKETSLYITLLQSREELEDIFRSHGWESGGLEIRELPDSVYQEATNEQTVFSSADIELNEATDAIVETIESIKPQRLVIDSASELSLLVDDPYQLRKQLLRI